MPVGFRVKSRAGVEFRRLAKDILKQYVLIPKLDSISVKSAAALLNSTLYHYYYSLKFADIKVLKGNLQELPFPKLTKRQDDDLASLVADIQSASYSASYQKELDKKVYSIFGITAEEQKKISIRVK